jgi:tRNA(adenine34) deaminase
MNDEHTDEYWMQQAYQAAQQAIAEKEVPVGAVLVRHGTKLAIGWNQVRTLRDPLAHAEMMAIREACQHLGSERLTDTTLYVTLEPCLMCMGAILHARVHRLVYATRDPRAGAAGSRFNFCQGMGLYPKIQMDEGVLQEPCQLLLKKFFQQKRLKR